MEVTFSTIEFKRTCESATQLRRAYGASCAEKLMLRLTELRAAPCLDDLRGLGGRCRALDAAHAGQFALDLSRRRCLVFASSDHTSAEVQRRSFDWQSVDAVVVIEVVDNQNA